MNKIVVIGPPGAGKTEFANELGIVLGIKDVFHLDYYFWKPGWTKTTLKERLSIIRELTNRLNWIIEGNFLDTIDEQFFYADIVVWLNLAPWINLYRVLNRYLGYIGRERPLIAPGCKDKITPRFLLSIILYRFVDAKIIRRKIANQSRLSVVILDSPDQVAYYLKNAAEKLPIKN